MKRIISTRAILFCLCFSTTFLLRGQNFSDPDPEFNQLEEYLSKGRIPPMEIENIRNKLKSGTSTNADIGNPPDWNWVRTFGGSGGVTVTDIEVDGSGNLYFLATFCDTIKFLGHTFISQGIRDVLVTKISSLGTYVWGSQLKATVEQNIYSKSLAIGTNGKVFISGNLNSTTITGGSITKTRIGEENIFNAGLDNNGIFLWLKINNKPETIEMYADAKGDIYQLTSDSLLKLSQSGNILWAKEIGGDNFDFKNEDGKIWISGKVDNPGIIIADEVFIPTIFSSGIYLIEMDTTGIYLRRKFIEYSEYYPYTSAYLELDSKGNIYLSGYIPGEIYFNGTIFSNPEGMYVFKLNSNLELVWKLNDFSGNLQFQKFNKSNNDRFYLYGFYSLSSSVDSIKIGNINVIPFNDSEDNLTGYYLAEIDSSGNVLRINTDNEMFGDFVVKSPDILYSVPVYSYDVIIEKTTLDGAQFWGFEIENTGGSASFWYTMDIDEDGNMYGQGYCYGNAKMINQNIESSGFIFVKFDNSGNLKWVRIMENPAGMSSGVRVDKSGNMYAWGTFDKYIKIQGQEYQATTASDIYLIKFDQDGDLKFVKQFDGDSYIIGTGGIDIDQAGNIIITGTFPGTLKFGIYELVSYNNSRDIFLAKIDPNGNIIWARAYGGALTDWGRSVTVDDFNNIYITGSYSDSIAFDSFIFKKISGGNDMFITKLDPQGNVIWANEGGSNNNSLRGHAIAVKGKNIFVQGYSASIGPIYFNSGKISLMSEFFYNSFITNLDTDGKTKWVKLIKANNYNWPMYGIDADDNGNVYIGGIFSDTLAIEGNMIEGSLGYNYYIAKYNTDGNLNWLKTSEQSNTGNIELFSLKVFDENIVLVAGRVSNGVFQVGDNRIITGGSNSFAGLIGEAIIGCEMDLGLFIVNTQVGDSSGSAKVSVSGGTEPYYIRWSNGQEDRDQITEQPAGIYQVTVEDAKGCIQYKEFAINYTNGPVITIDSIHDVSCFGYADGFIRINVTGGTPPYQYNWSNGMKTENIEQLQAAPYEVQVKDAQGLISYQGFVVSGPKKLDITYDLYPASCGGGVNGRIDLFVSGGTEPYEYEWSTGWTTDDLSGIPAGKYKVTTTDNNGCVSFKDIALSESGSSIVETDSIINASCNQSDGQVTIRILNPGGVLTYTWSNGATTPFLSGVKAGDYFVNVVNQDGCKAVHKVTIGDRLPPENPICLVTVDTTTGSNLVVWEKVANTETYYIFRETSQKDLYLLAGNVPGNALSVFTDSVANPRIRGYRYKIAAVDECGNVSVLSALHKTIHLTISLGLSNSINLMWDDYVGQDMESIEVWRYSSITGWELLETLPGNLYSYTDFNVPPGKVFYNVRVPFPNKCYPEGYKKADSGPYSHSMSNIEDNRFQTGDAEIIINPGFYIYPNPTTGKFYMWSESVKLENPEVEVLDLQGRVILDKKYADNSDGKIAIDVSGHAEGSYIVKVRSGDYIMFDKLIIQ